MGILTSSKILLTNKKKLLLWLRDNDQPINDPNKWDLPGRDIKLNVSPAETISVDLTERFNIHLESKPFLLGKTHSSIGIEHYIFIYYASDNEIQNMHISKWGQEASFFDIDKLDQVELTPPLKIYLSKYGKYLTECLQKSLSYSKIDPLKLGLY